MATRFRQIVQVSVAALALGASGFASADGITGKIAERAREQQQRSEPQRESRAEPRQQPRAEPRAAPRNEPRNEPRVATPRAEPRNNAPAAQPRNDRPRNERPRTAQPAAAAPSAPVMGPARPNSSNNNTNNARSGDRSDRSDRSDRGVVGGLIQREYQTRDNRPDRPVNNRPNRNDDRGWDRDRDNRDGWRDRERDRRRWEREHRHVQVVPRLPSGYRDYSWNGSRYYYHSGLWYRPSGSTFISVGVPYGLFVSSLPGSYSSVWVGGTRYFYSDYHYYTYEPARRGYVVTRSPYEEEEVDERLDQDLYIYPAQGQSEQQQADDRYGCHRWAVDETNYDPIDDEYDASLRQDYLRAMTACLTGRGYTVR